MPFKIKEPIYKTLIRGMDITLNFRQIFFSFYQYCKDFDKMNVDTSEKMFSLM